MATTTPAVRSVPFFNYKGAFSADEPAYLAIVSDIIRRGAFIQQRDLADFEQSIAEYVGVKHAIGVGNATDGLMLAYRAAGIGPGDEVIFPSHTMVASPAAVALVGATPVCVDIGDDHLIDPAAVEAAITPRTKAIMPVHLNGRTCAMDPILDITKRHNLMIIEDAAQALGSKYKGQFAGTFGFAAAISFYPAKILGCFGDGGIVVTNDDEGARKIRLLRDHGRNDSGDVEFWGHNSRLDNLQAAILHHQFREYDAIVAYRRSLGAVYQDRLGDVKELALPPAPDAHPDHYDVFQNYEIEAERRDELKRFLGEHGIGTLIQWGGKAVHQFSALGLAGRFPKTDAFFQRCIMLPLNMMVSEDDADYISGKIREFYS